MMVGDPSDPLLRYSRKKLNTAILVTTILQGPCESSLTHFHRPGSSVPELSNPVKAAPELSSSQHLSTSLQRLYRYFATVVRYFATSR